MQPPVDKLKSLIGGCFLMQMLEFSYHKKDDRIIIGGLL
jgi:hypothetical protein